MSDETKNYLIFGATSDLAKAVIEIENPEISWTLVARDSAKLATVSGKSHISAKHVCDLADETAVKTLIKNFKSEKRKFDGIFCAVGSHEAMPLRLYSKAKFQAIFENNVFTVTNILTAASGIMNPGAGIVVTSSAVTMRGGATVAGYNASKAALESLVRTAALEFASKKIRVNAVAPGVFESRMSAEYMETFSEAQLEGLKASHPLGIGSCEDVAKCVHFLISSQASWVTGQTLIVDGGYSIHA